MITQADIAHWRTHVPWISPEDIEQDLVLSRLVIEFAQHSLLGKELLFRGGTCLHKLWLDKPWRYSEDLDYVRRSQGGVGQVLDAIREVAADAGFDEVRTQIGRHPKARLRSTFAGGRRLQIKVEINTFERFPARPTVTRGFCIDSPWFSGSTEVPTFALEELTATKIRALFQRSRAATCSTSGLRSDRRGRFQQRSHAVSTVTGRKAGRRGAHWPTSMQSSIATTSGATSILF